jgi:hypothetical protein
VRRLGEAITPIDDPLDFVEAAIRLGCSRDLAAEIDARLVARIMTARGVI